MRMYYNNFQILLLTGHSEHFEAQAEYSFDAENEDEICFQAGDVLRVAPKHKQPHVRGWLLASVDGKISGLVPANYIKVSFHLITRF